MESQEDSGAQDGASWGSRKLTEKWVPKAEGGGHLKGKAGPQHQMSLKVGSDNV